MARSTVETFKKSSLLTDSENRRVQKLIGVNCQALSTCVVQLFETEPPDHDRWVKRDAGILCLIKDNEERSYFLRLFCLVRKAMVWQQEIFRSFEIQTPKPFLHVFDGQGCVYAINYASEDEANMTLDIIKKKVEKSRQKGAKQTAESGASSAAGASSDEKVEVSDDEAAGASSKPSDGEEPAAAGEGEEVPAIANGAESEKEALPGMEGAKTGDKEAEPKAPPTAEVVEAEKKKEGGEADKAKEEAGEVKDAEDGVKGKDKEGDSPGKTSSLTSQTSAKAGSPPKPDSDTKEGEDIPTQESGVQDAVEPNVSSQQENGPHITPESTLESKNADDGEDITAILEKAKKEKEQKEGQEGAIES